MMTKFGIIHPEKMIFWAEIRIFGPQKTAHFLRLTLFQGTTGQSRQKEKVPLSQVDINLL